MIILLHIQLNKRKNLHFNFCIMKIFEFNSNNMDTREFIKYCKENFPTIKIPIINKTPWYQSKRFDIEVKINNEAKINDFIVNQKTLSLEIIDNEIIVLNKTINNVERVIVATNKERPFTTKLDIVKMKINKFTYDLSVDMAFFFKKQLVLNYDFYLKMTTFSKIIKSVNVFLLNLFLRISKISKNLSLEKQKSLVDNKYYYKEKIFSDDELYTVAKEIASEISRKHLKLTIKNIQEMFSIESYRQARKIYLFIKENKLVW